MALFVPVLSGGGAEQVMLDLANGFGRAGLDVHIVTTAVDADMALDAGPGVVIKNLGCSRLSRAVLPLAQYLRTVAPASLLSTLGGGNLVAVLASRLAMTGTRLVLREANTVSSVAQYDRSWRGRLIRRMVPITYRCADAIVAVSEGVRDDLCHVTGLPKHRVNVIYNPVITRRMRFLAANAIADPWLDDRRTPVIVGMGRLTTQKGFDTLIRAFSIVRRDRHARLLILGEGEERGRLEALVDELRLRECIRLPGRVANPFPYLTKARLFVLSSRWEGLPNALIQALACGCPVISTRCHSGPSEILQDGMLGKLVPSDDPGELAKAIVEELAAASSTVSPATRASLDRFEEDRVVRAYIDLMTGGYA